MNSCSVPKNEGVLAYPRDFLEKEVKNCYSGLRAWGWELVASLCLPSEDVTLVSSRIV